MNKKQALTLLGLTEDTSSEQEIKKAYKKLAKKYHPDVNKEADAAARFNEISEAYNFLLQKEEPSPELHNFQGFNDFFNSFFRQGGNVHPEVKPKPNFIPIPAQDSSLDIPISLYQYLTEATIKFKVQIKKACTSCLQDEDFFSKCNQCLGYGTVTTSVNTPFGQMQQHRPCSFCNGAGWNRTTICGTCKNKLFINEIKEFSWKIPSKSLEFNKPLVFKNCGNIGHLTGPSNLFITPKLIFPKLNLLSEDDLITLTNLLSKV